MKNQVKQLIVAFLLLLMGLPLGAQTVSAAFKAYTSAMNGHENISMEVDVLSYATAQTKSGSKVGSGMMRSSKDGYYSRFLSDEFLMNKEHIVLLDHESKKITLFNETAVKKQKKQFLPDMDSLLVRSDSSKWIGVRNGEEIVELYSKDGDVRKTEIHFNSQNHLINRITYFYPPANAENDYGAYKVDVVYRNVSFAALDKSLFTESPFVEYKNKHWQTADAYRNYKLIISSLPKS